MKDLLELYIRDPTAFDQYARTYYYGERAQRQLAAASAAQHNGRMMPDRLSGFTILMLAGLYFSYTCIFSVSLLYKPGYKHAQSLQSFTEPA